jgi:hypothetical protein
MLDLIILALRNNVANHLIKTILTRIKSQNIDTNISNDFLYLTFWNCNILKSIALDMTLKETTKRKSQELRSGESGG